jgi:hypothetical protein
MVAADAAAFRGELLTLIGEIDRGWDSEPDWDSPQGFQWNDLSAHPTLRKYLDALETQPRVASRPTTMKKGGLHWLTFPMRGGAYTPEDMVNALVEVVEAKIAKYAAKPAGVDEFHLLVHYDKAWEYNTPVIGIDFGYPEVVAAAAARIGSQAGMFDRIFVFVPIADKAKVFLLFPS